ncbi:MAG: T9SS type A sorting domain-containing protein [Chitinophagales bacterium]|nr:T9SS type A sorting domain-containing protein [Chitinophagales bacterium]
MKAIVILAFSLFLSGFCLAQSSPLFVDSMKVIPANPNENDSVSFIAYKSHPNISSFYDRRIVKFDSIISIFSCWNSGSFPMVDRVNDTFALGKLAQGSYTIRYLLKFLDPWELDSVEPCLTNPYYDSAFLNFTVSGINNVKRLKEEALSLSPNPATTHLTIALPELMHTAVFTITNISGSIVQTEQLSSATTTIPINHLPAGLYFATIQTNQQHIIQKFIKLTGY